LITLQFSAFNFLSPDKIIYAYKLEGFNDDWQNTGKDHSVTFTNLDPGSYRLIVRASFNGQVWGPQKSLTIIIQTPWWKTSYFRWIAFLLFVAAGYIYYRYRTYQLKQRKKELEHLVSLQGQEIQKQNHDLAAQNEELKAQNDEMTAQQEMIVEQNQLLNEAKKSLQAINESLEQVVDQRTEKLNETIHQLNKTIRELDAFVYSASHDLIAPMKSVMGLIELARRHNQNEEISTYIDHIERSVKKLEDVILNMIQYSQNSSLEVIYEEVNLFALIQESIADLKFYPGMEAMTFMIDFNNDAKVMCDRNRLRIILNNLIGNSVKYRDDRKESNEVQIRFEKGKTIWKLEIQDNGIGIDKQYLSRVFEMFFRATDRSKGSGLGLYIVKETVERLYGEIYVDSEKGKWTKFTIAIPHENTYLRKK
jgi:signal transduction histidine kinase